MKDPTPPPSIPLTIVQYEPIKNATNQGSPEGL